MDPITYQQGVAGEVRRIQAEAQINDLDLSIRAGIPRSTLQRRLSGETPFTARELAKLGAALGVAPSDILLAVESAA